MRILRIIKEDNQENKTRKELIREMGAGVEHISPTPFSAFTAIKIAKAVDRDDINIVEVTDTKNAMAAISARKIAKRDFKIAIIIAPNSPAPLGIPKEIRQGIDLWVFPSERLLKEYPAELIKTTVLPPASFEIMAPVAKPDNSEITISWIGEIDAPGTLKSAVDALEESGGRFTLRIAGAGRAGAVMPVVRYARDIKHADKVVWVSGDFDLAEEIGKSSAVILRGEDLSENECAALLSGRNVLKPEEIAEFINVPVLNHNDDRYSARHYVNQLIKTYSSII